MKVDIWSDVVCPFCYIGKRKFEKALQDFAGKKHINITWHSFQLDPEMENAEGLSVHEYLGKRKGVSAADGKRMNDQMTAIAKEVGLEYDFDKAIITNTQTAHRLLHFAKSKGVQNEMKERLFKAYYTEGKNVGDIDTLAALAAEVGLDAEEVKATLHSDAYVQDVYDDQQEAYSIGVQGVPFFVFNDKYAVSGAQPPHVFAQVLDKVWEEEKPVLQVLDGEGFCTIDGHCS
jgi:predicted DsbA family dithiol-disulfide isomerase